VSYIQVSYGYENQSGHPLSPRTQVLSAAGAIDLDARSVELNVASGTYAVTLAAPTAAQAGLVKEIHLNDDAGTSVTLALTNVVNASGNTTATFTVAGHSLVLCASRARWVLIGSTAALSGA
jgi:hypothetical protein